MRSAIGKGLLACVAAMLLVPLLAPSSFGANPGTGTTTTGQALNVQIDSPTDGSTVAPGTIGVTGRAAIGALATSANTFYMLDVSGSTSSPSGLDCDGNGTAGEANDNFNGDSVVGDTLDCEISGVTALNSSLGSTPGVSAGLGAFSSGTAAIADVDPSATDALFTSPPDADLNSNANADINEVATSVVRTSIGQFTARAAGGGGTDFNSAITAINTAFAGTAGQTNIAFLLTDGVGSLTTGVGSALDTATTAGTAIYTFSVGGSAAGCGASSPLATIATTTGASCTEVTNPALLSATLGGVTPAGLQSVTVSVNGGTPVPAALDALGNWTADVTVGTGTSTLVATVTATDGTTASTDITVSTVTNTAPVADPQSVSTPKDTAVPITLTGSDTDGDTLSYAIATGPAHGTLSGTAPGVTYTPAAGYTGPDSFTFTVSDAQDTSAPAEVSITVTDQNQPPKCHFHGRHGRGNLWHVPKGHRYLKVRNHGRSWVKVTVFVNGHRRLSAKIGHGAAHVYNLGRYFTSNGRDRISIDAAGSRNDSDVSFEVARTRA